METPNSDLEKPYWKTPLLLWLMPHVWSLLNAKMKYEVLNCIKYDITWGKTSKETKKKLRMLSLVPNNFLNS